MTDLLTLISRDTRLRKTSAHNGGEYSGPCPICRRGTDRFKVWPYAGHGPIKGQWACLGPAAGRSGCDRGGDAIQYLRERDGIGYREACDRLGLAMQKNTQSSPRRVEVPEAESSVDVLQPPNTTWQAHGGGWAARCAVLLWSDEGVRARDYLHKRGLNDGVLRRFNVGYNPVDVYEDHAAWGLPCPDQGTHRIWIPRGVTFPWVVDGTLWRLNVRRPLTPSQIAAGQAKYIGPAGFANALYNADSLRARSGQYNPVVLVEGEIDALTIAQACGDEIAAVATGSTAGARRKQWIWRLAQAPVVLVAFDWDKGSDNFSPGAGERAAAWWLNALPNAQRLRPLLHDVNSLPDPEEVRGWIARALRR
jgi:hypothetical protein